MEYLFIYLLQICENIRSLGCIIGFITFFTTIALAVAVVITIANGFDPYSSKEEINKFKNTSKTIGKITGVLIIIDFLIMSIPTKQTIILLGGTYYGKKAVKQVVTSQKLEKVNTIIDLQLDKYIKDLKQETK